MDGRQIRQSWIGAAVLLAGCAVMALTAFVDSRRSVDGYDLRARFNKAEGIGLGSDVRLAGVSVGRVVGSDLDPNFRAVLQLRISRTVKLPEDTAAVIQTDGLLGGKFIALQPGGETDSLKPGSEIAYTQDSVNVQDLLELIIGQAKSKRAAKAAAGGSPAAPSAPAVPSDLSKETEK